MPVSVIVCAQDESENLKQFLPHIYRQDYPDFQVVLIDDRSIDDTYWIMKDFEEKYPDQTYVVEVKPPTDLRFVANKKYALSLGIKAAKHNYLLFTDADCQPVSKDWIAKMSKAFSNDKQLVLGYGKYQIQKSFLNKLIRYETLLTALQYFSYSLKGLTYMGVGRNMAYTKELFMENDGFIKHLDILSGDDDLFVNEVSTAKNTAICVDKNSFTVSKPKTNWKDFIYQKRRHISTASHYKFKHRLLLGLYYTSLTGFWITAISLLITAYQWQIVLGLFIFRWLIWYFIIYKSTRKLNEPGVVLFLFILEPVLILFQLLIFVLNLIKKPKYWTAY